MHQIRFVVAALACAGYGRRLHNSKSTDVHEKRSEDWDIVNVTPHSASGVGHPELHSAKHEMATHEISQSRRHEDAEGNPKSLKAFELLLASLQPAVAFSLSGADSSMLRSSADSRLGARRTSAAFGPVMMPMIIDPATTLTVLQQQERTLEDLFVSATPSVVYIDVFAKQMSQFSLNPVEISQGVGSGFVWDNDGHIVTNYHVIKGASSAKVGVSVDPKKKPVVFDAELVGYNPDKDVAVLKLRGPGIESLRPINLGSSERLRIGQTALAIGNPFGLDHTLTTGVVSGLGREQQAPTGRTIKGMIQTDAAINPGNSGGVLLDSSGRLIGMNTAIQSLSGSSSGIGFAIPVDTLKNQVAAIIKDGFVARPGLGITYIGGPQANQLGIERGLLVIDVQRGSAADRAGIKGTTRDRFGDIVFGDVIVKLGNSEIVTEDDFFTALDDYKIGDQVTVTVDRLEQLQGGRIQEVEAQLSLKLQAQRDV